MAIRTLTLTMIDPPIPDQDAVFGQAIAIDLRVPFRDASTAYTYTVTGSLPLGSFQSGHQIVGTPYREKMRTEITVEAFDGAVSQGTATFNLGCTCKAGIPAPNFENFYVDTDEAISQLGFTTDVEVSASAAALETALETAYGDGGTATTPKLHRVRWTGGDLPAEAIRCNHVGGFVENHAWVILEGNGAQFRNITPQSGDAMIARNLVLTGNTTLGGVGGGPIRLQVEGSSIGNWFGATPNERLQTAVSKITFNNLTLVGCDLAGGGDLVSAENHKMTVVDCLMRHLSSDHFNSVDPGDVTDTRLRIIGAVMGGMRQVSSSTHPDNIQSGGAQTNILQMYECIVIGDCTVYGGTSIRYQAENGDKTLNNNNFDIQDCFFAGSGATNLAFDTGTTGSINVRNMVIAPPPGFGSRNHGFYFTDLPYTLENVIAAGSTPLEISGTNTSYSLTSAVSVDAVFPNLGGSIVAYSSFTNDPGALSTYTAPELEVTAHPQAWRNAIATAYEPSGGWFDGKPPSSYGGVYDWGAIPTFSRPTLTSGSVTGDQLTITCDTTDAYIWAFVSGNSATPKFLFLKQATEPDGTYEASPETLVSVYKVSGSGAQTYTLPKVATGLHVHVAAEKTDGSFSTVTTITP